MPHTSSAADPKLRIRVRDAAISAVYRNARSDAAAAASAQDWAECLRLERIARSIEIAYPDISARARFPPNMVAATDALSQLSNNEL